MVCGISEIIHLQVKMFQGCLNYNPKNWLYFDESEDFRVGKSMVLLEDVSLITEVFELCPIQSVNSSSK